MGSPFTPRVDAVHLLASLCEASRQPSGTGPWIAAASGGRPIRWTEFDPSRQRAPEGSIAVGVVGSGTTATGDDVIVAIVVDHQGRQRAVVFHHDRIIDTDVIDGELVAACRDALGLADAA